MHRLIIIAIVIYFSCSASFAQAMYDVAPGAPGGDAHWPSAAKNGLGTSNTPASKVWFTLQGGVMTEVYYPRLDVPNTQTLQLVVVREQGVETESDDMVHRLEILDPRALSFRQINAARNGDYTITKTYTTDPRRPTILIDVSFSTRGNTKYSLYAYYDPSLNNSGRHDSGSIRGKALLSSEGSVASALVSSSGFADMTNGYLGTSDGLLQLKRSRAITESYTRAENGNVVQVARIRDPKAFTLALGFGGSTNEALANANSSLSKGFSRVRRQYEAGWHSYLKRLRHVEPAFLPQFNMSAMVLKALEDKTYRGAMIASPSIPWGGGPNANEATISGYHAVWARDLYHVGTAFIAMGDRDSANRALDYLFKVQQKADGSFPQNSWVDGRPIGGGLQLDQVAFPIILAYQLKRHDRNTWLKHIRPAADFILANGPRTQQERWEEEPGYSPSTIGAEIAALACAADIASSHSDSISASRYLKKADEWFHNVDRWTSTATGPLSVRNYYLRISDDEDPNDGAKIEINSGGGTYDEREIVDAGFLELVRLGIKPAADPSVINSLTVVDKLIKIQTPQGPAWYRYNHDAYGEGPDERDYDGRTGIGRLWSLLTGERGEYELARGDRVEARKHLEAMMRFANDGLMIAEQIWDRREFPGADLRFGAARGPHSGSAGSPAEDLGWGARPPGVVGTGSATPLAWSMAQFIRLAINLEDGHNSETPAVVAARYAKRPGTK